MTPSSGLFLSGVMMMLARAFTIGVVAGLRTLIAPAVISRTTTHGSGGGVVGVLGHPVTSVALGLLASGELLGDKSSQAPSREIPSAFIARIVSGALSGSALCARRRQAIPDMVLGALAGAGGAVVGTLGGAALRQRLANAFGRDWPAALLEDVVAVSAAALIAGKRA
ncbi:MAG: DUF4126 domain-containing protein [Asticcacaulis sp.]